MTAYVLSLVTVTDPERFQEYAKRALPLIEKSGGRVLARGANQKLLEGEDLPTRIVVIEFPSVEKAVAHYRSPAYLAAKKFREGAGSIHMMVVEAVPKA